MTSNLARLTSLILVWACLLPCLALACRYNVRDVGFVDLETESYRLYAFVRSNTPPDSVAVVHEVSAAALRDSNVNVEVVNTDQQINHPALKHLAAGLSSAALAAVLVSPDGQALPLSLAPVGLTFRQALLAALQEIVSSPKREEILRTVSRAFGAVLLIEGENETENGRARRAISEASEQIRMQMKEMPKTIAEPPAMLVLDAASFARERVLLWSLGLDVTRARQPRAAVLYGRARWIGPLMKGDEITEPNLTGIFSIIGADCECGLDLAWTQGTRLPVRWEAKRHAEVAKALGFDPESPMVKLEISRILGRRGSAKMAAAGDREVTLDSGSGSMATAVSGPTRSNRVAEAAPGDGRAPIAPVLAESGPSWRWSLLVMAGLAALIVAVGGWILLRSAARRRNE